MAPRDEFLLEGALPRAGRRLAIMPALGGALQDVVAAADPASAEPGTLPMLDHVARGADGRIYFTSAGSRSLHVLTAHAGTSEEAFRLPEVPRLWRIFDLMAASNRLALVYYESGKRADDGRFWIAVHDALLGDRLALYGPAPGAPVCYEHVGGQDRFTVLQGGYRLTLSAF
jgi:hypothetical protein